MDKTAISALIHRLPAFRGSKGQVVRQAVAARTQPVVSPPPEAGGDDEQVRFVAAVRRMSAANPRLCSRIHVVCLADFREAAAEKWTRLAGKVGLLTRAVIRRHLGSLALFAQVDEDIFVIALPGLSRQQARGRTAAIANDLGSRLLGDLLIAGQRSLAVTVNLPLAVAMTPDRGLDAAAIRHCVEATRAIVAIPPDQPAHGAREPLVRLRQSSSIGSARRGKDDFDAALPPADEAEAFAVGPEPGEWLRLLRAERKIIHRWRCFRADHGPPSDRPDGEDGLQLPEGALLSVVWRPIWMAEREGIAAYCARILRRDHPGGALLEGPAAYAARSPARALALDRRAVAAAMAACHGVDAEQGRASLIIPLAWSSLDGASRWALAAPIARLPLAVRRVRLKLEVCRLPAAVSEDTLRDVVSFVRSLGCDCLVRLRPSHVPMGPVAQSRPALVGLDLSELAADEQMGDEDLLANLNRFSRMAGLYDIGCYLWGVRRREVLRGAILGGYKMVGGPALAPDLGRPQGVLPVSRRQLAEVT